MRVQINVSENSDHAVKFNGIEESKGALISIFYVIVLTLFSVGTIVNLLQFLFTFDLSYLLSFLVKGVISSVMFYIGAIYIDIVLKDDKHSTLWDLLF